MTLHTGEKAGFEGKIGSQRWGLLACVLVDIDRERLAVCAVLSLDSIGSRMCGRDGLAGGEERIQPNKTAKERKMKEEV